MFLVEESITQEKVLDYCKASGDFNPIHFDVKSAEALGLGRPIAHGMFLIGLAYRVLNEQFSDMRVLTLDTKFTHPVRVGDILVLTCKEISSQENTRTVAVMMNSKNDLSQGTYCQITAKLTREGAR